jgi:aspartate aminotransferase-like enzyme
MSWLELDRQLRAQGVGIGGNYGQLAGRVFRIGHMGTQADESLVNQTLEALSRALHAVG